MKIKNAVTASLIVFLTAVIIIFGAAVLSNPQKTNTTTTNQQNIKTSISNSSGDEDNNPNDEEGENTPVIPPVQNNNNQNQAKALTVAQVAIHNTISDCWVIISSKAYDVTNLIPAHSGGANNIIPYCGKDATSAFETKNGRGSHSQNAQNILNTLYVGNIGG